MQRDVRGVHIQDQLLGGRGEAGDEVFDQHAMQRPGIGTGSARLQATQRGRAGQRSITPDGRLHQQIGMQGIVVVQVFVAAGQAV